MKCQNRFYLVGLLIALALTFALIGPDAQAAFNYVMGTDFFPEPNIPMPAKGETVIDPNFGLGIIRITDKELDGHSRFDRMVLTPEYSRSAIENADRSKILLMHEEYYIYIYDAHTFQLLKRLSQYDGGTIPAHTESGNEPRWDATDPNAFYYVRGMRFLKYDLSTDTSTLIHDFEIEYPDGWWLGNDVEGEPSMDARYWGFFVRGSPPEYPDWDRFVAFTYDLQTDTILGELKEDNPYGVDPGGNTISISPYGDRVIIEHFWPTPTTSYNLDFTDPVQLGHDGHSDLGIDAEGNQVHVIKDDANDVIAMLDLRTGKRTNLVRLPVTGSWDTEPGMHISGNNYNKPGWAVVSTSGGGSGTWAYHQIYMVELKENPRIWRIAHTHATSYDYWGSPKATINRDGTRIYFGSNWNAGEAADLNTYMIELPQTWWEDLGGTSPTTFIDVPLSHWAHDYIETLYQQGFITGCSTDPLMYCPDDTMTRAESAVFVERGIHGGDYLPIQPKEQIFVDVPLWEWFAKWSTGLWNDGYTAGCGTNPLVYCPLQGHTRTEGCVFFLRMLKGTDYVPPDPQGIFSDVSQDGWGTKWIEAAYNAGIIPACESTPELRFCPNVPLDRAMAAYMMVQAKEIDSQ
ncbi:MAG: hypothetical protein A2Z14_17990 [Chloroflexi bacterium RBG_16_48_8]|nr:MAG: hypothetical protein A2Z14_17990 [Chloroflexi bacterium RBG_16_48_8]